MVLNRSLFSTGYAKFIGRNDFKFYKAELGYNL